MDDVKRYRFGQEFYEYLTMSHALGVRIRDAVLLVFLNLAAGVSESIGLTAFIPLIQLATGSDKPIAKEGNNIVAAISNVLQTLHLPTSFETLLLMVVVMLLVRQVFVFLRSGVGTVIQERVRHHFREGLFERFVHADMAFQDRSSGGQFFNSFATEIQIATTAIFAPVALINVSMMAVMYLLLILWASVGMTLISLATLTIAVLLLFRLMGISRRAGQELTLTNRMITDFLVQRIGSLRLLRLSGTEDVETARMSALSNNIYRINARIGYLSSSLNVLMEPIVIAAGLVILYFGVRKFGMQAGEVGFFVLVLLRLQPACKDALKLHQQWVTGMPTLRSLYNRFEEMESARESRSGAAPMPPLSKGIVFEKVDFAYPNVQNAASREALKDIELVIPARKMTALVGPSGAGKSTLIDLLPRLRTPTRGRITVDGEPLDDIDIRALRASIGYVAQSPRILGATPREHICYGAPEASDAEIIAAAQMAGAHEFISSLQGGYDALLGEEARLLSGGERQRLDLARALLRGAPILILDEPSSNLDVTSEAKLQEALTRLRQQGRTTIIVIAHRLATITQADLIVALRDGRIEASGNHQQLLARSQWYADACDRQLGPQAAASVSVPAQ